MDDTERSDLERRLAVLQAQNAALESSVRNLEERMIRCPLTGLYNEEFFQEYMRGAVDVSLDVHADGVLLFISIDRLSDLNIRLGTATADETIKKFAAFLPKLAPEEAVFFRLSGALFACYLAEVSREFGAALAERVRSGVEGADIFAERITASIGVIAISEFRDQESEDRRLLVERILNQAKIRLGIARRMGANAVCASGAIEASALAERGVVIADADAFRRSLIAELLTAQRFVVHEAASGDAALDTALRNEPSLIIADFALPGLDAVSLRARLRESTELARVPFMMIVDRKSGEVAKRAYALGIAAILQRPILIEEFLGLAENLVTEAGADAR